MKRLILLSALFLAGCSTPERTAASTDHPANPSAPVGAARAPASSPASAPTTHSHDQAIPDDQSAGQHQHPGQDSGASAPAAATLYMCPMHPEVTSTNPADRCPKCGMKIDKPVPAEPHP